MCDCTSDGSTLVLFNFNLRILQLEIQKSHKKELCSKPRWPCGKERDRKSLVAQRLVQVPLFLRGVEEGAVSPPEASEG